MPAESPAAHPVWALLRDARRRAGLTQRQLADRAGTSQAAIARYERARAMPDIATLRRLLGACGFDLSWTLQPRGDHPDAQIRDALALTPAARLRANRRLSRLAGAAGRASATAERD